MAKKQSKSQPFENIRIGNVKAAIWKNDGDNGPRYNVTFQRLYRTEEGKWLSTTSFNRDDLLVLQKVANEVHTRIHQLIEESRKSQKEAQPA